MNHHYPFLQNWTRACTHLELKHNIQWWLSVCHWDNNHLIYNPTLAPHKGGHALYPFLFKLLSLGFKKNHFFLFFFGSWWVCDSRKAFVNSKPFKNCQWMNKEHISKKKNLINYFPWNGSGSKTFIMRTSVLSFSF